VCTEVFEGIKSTFLNPNPNPGQRPIEIIYHISDLYVSEIIKVDSQITSDNLFLLVEPFIEMILKCKHEFTMNYIKRAIFIELASFDERDVLTNDMLLVDYDFFAIEIDKCGKSQECLDKNREVFYDLRDRFVLSSSMQKDQLDRRSKSW